MPLDASTILGTSASRVAEIFPGDARSVRKAFRQLAAAWHPDVCQDPAASDVFAHLVALRDHALSRKPGSGKPRRKSPEHVLVRADGGRLAIRPLARRAIDFGEVFVLASSLSFLVDDDIADLEERAVSGFRFADALMEKQMSPFLPSSPKRIALKGGKSILAYPRKSQEIWLADLLDAKGALPEKHAAWLGSGLLNIACWMNWAGIVHGAISPETILVDPGSHSVRLLGWGCSLRAGERPTVLPDRTLRLIPRLALPGEAAGPGVDGELIRQTLREALGDASGAVLPRSALPDPIKTWIMVPPAGDAFKDYAAWQSALEAAWGKRRFISFDVSADDIYFSA